MTFLRPWFLCALLIPFLIKGIRHLKHQETPWVKFIDKALLPALLVKPKGGKLKKLWNAQIGILWALWTIALAGPAFYKLPTPAVETAPNSVIVFDLSMQGKDLLQGQAKLYDLLSALKGERVGLVVFGQNQGYTAMPLTPDIGLIKEVVPTLTPVVLPSIATNPKAGFDYAAELLDNAGGKGRILYVTNKGTNWSGRYPFGVLDLTKRTADNSDILMLLEKTKKAVPTAERGTFSTQADEWADLGGWIVLISLPFLAWIFRKGGLFLLLFLMGFQVEAGFFWRTDQEIYHSEKKAIDAYQNKDYKKASHLFQQTRNLYNLGNALAFSGDIQGAIDAYQKELEKNPANEDALFNKEYLEKQLPPPDEEQKQHDDGESEDNKNNSDDNADQDQQGNNQNEENQENQDHQNSEQNQQEQSEAEEQKDEGQTNEQPTQDQTQAELEQALAESEEENNYNQEEQQIINRLNHDPSRVLRYRLMLQHQKGQRK